MSRLEDICNDYIANGLDGFGKIFKATEDASKRVASFLGECFVWSVAITVMVVLLPFALYNYWRKDA